MKKHTGSECKNSLYLESAITLKIYREMLHCIGFDRKKVKYGKFKEWRNRFCLGASSDTSTWESLVSKNLAKCWTIKEGDYMYYLTDLGFEFIARFENVVIERED
jgi:hypothetical protein